MLLFGYIFGQVASHLTNTGAVRAERESTIVTLWRHMAQEDKDNGAMLTVLRCLPAPSSLQLTSLSNDEVTALLPASVNSEVGSTSTAPSRVRPALTPAMGAQPNQASMSPSNPAPRCDCIPWVPRFAASLVLLLARMTSGAPLCPI